jgi:HKD family nuclease
MGTLFPGANGSVIALPKNFDLVASLKASHHIRLATAFAHESGWQLIKGGIEKSTGRVDLLTGLYMNGTEPKLLRTWRRLSNSSPNGRIRARLLLVPYEFHPKVLIARSNYGDFAIVGSGNLTAHGLKKNVECFVYTRTPSHITDLESWFDGLFQSDGAKDLDKEDIDEYERTRKPTEQFLQKLELSSLRSQQKIVEMHEASMAHRNKAIQAAKKYFATRRFRKSYRDRSRAAQAIKKALRYPDFNFDENGWKVFYSIWDLGHLIAIYRDSIFKKRTRLVGALTQLVNEDKPIEARVESVISPAGKHYLRGVGLNLLSKILAVHDPKAWPVYNKRVSLSLKKFGYRNARGLSTARKYAVFGEEMRKFMKETGAKDVFALDCFFYHVSKKLL